MNNSLEDLRNKIIPSKLPKHVAVIMDGNGRWAKGRGLSRIFGHKNAITAVRETVEGCAELGIKYLTLYAFSTENWNRPKFEVNALMELLVSTLNKEIKTLKDNDIRLQAIGDLKSLPKKCFDELQVAIDKTKNHKKTTLILALSYSAKWEILEATKKVANDIKNGQLTTDEIDEAIFSSYLSTKDYPDPELMIRTSGEYRISNFLLWQLAYSELKFLDKFWPDFRKEDLFKAIIEFQSRERRFGKTSEQIASK